MTKCTRCGGRANNAYLCPSCVSKVRDDLTALPFWQERLTEAVVGQTRLGGADGRGSSHDAMHAMPYNPAASELLGSIADTLGYWVRVLCESRGIAMPNLPAGTTLGKPAAIWLALHVDAIAASEDAVDIADDILGWEHGDHKRPGLIAQARRMVNRPINWTPLGDCPETVDGEPCGQRLRIPDHVDPINATVACEKCGTRHEALRLLRLASSDPRTDATPIPWDLIRHRNSQQPSGFRIPDRTLRDWRAKGLLVAHDGGYRWADVLELKASTVMRPGRRKVLV